MAYRYQQHIYSPAFQELAYRVLSRLAIEQKKDLPEEERAIFATEYSLQKFCKEERMDYVMYLLAKFGYSWTFRIEREGFEHEADLVEFHTADQYQYPQKRVDITEATAREGVCIISSRDVMNMSHMTAQNITSKVYNLSEFSQTLMKKGRWMGQLTKWDKDLEGLQEAHDIFNRVMLEQLNSINFLSEQLDLEMEDMRVLMALYQKKNIAVKMNDIAAITRSKGRKIYFRKSIAKLIAKDYLTSDQKEAKKAWANSTYYMITGKGIDVVMRYRRFVLEKTFGT